jgi:hypothetical protein
MPAPAVAYNTHILIGVHASGSMTVLCHWSHLPQQANVQDQINKAKEPFARFLLCTPTSILPTDENPKAGIYFRPLSIEFGFDQSIRSRNPTDLPPDPCALPR